MAIDYKKEGRIATFTLNRPQSLNAVNPEAFHELHRAMVDFRDDPAVWVGIITGAGDRAFCAGADIKEMLPLLRQSVNDFSNQPATTHLRGLNIYKPLIAAINGMALGGGLEIALACDIRIASETARFGLPEVTVGLIPGWGGTQRLLRMVPYCKAAELLLLGKPIDAQEAYRIGLVNKIVPADKVMAAALECAETICQAAPLAVRAAKEAMLRGAHLPLEEALRLENTIENSVVQTEDFTEGTTAFIEKRKPAYKAK